MDKVIVIVGPTGVGKTKLSINLAKKLNGEIISGDSVQVYKEMNIGSAKIKASEMEGINHYLIDIKNIDEEYSVYDFQKEVREKIQLILSKNKTPILVGGTGLYLKAALYDYEFSKEDSSEFNDYKELSNEQAYELLSSLDKIEASKLHPNNRVRVIRAINIINNSKMTKTELLAKQEHKLLYDAIFIGLTAPRDVVYDKINTRVDKMIEEGLIEEVKGLYDKYNEKQYQAFKAIGYKELFEYFDGNLSKDAAIELIKKRSRNYAKRQYTWFNNQFDVKWFNVDFNEFGTTINEVVNYIKLNEVFETKDLIIKKGSNDDLNDMYKNIWSKQESAKYMLWKVCQTLEDAKVRLDKWLQRQVGYDEWFVYEKVSNQAIGFCSINRIGENKFGDIGIGLGQDYVSKGYGSQILEFLISFAKDRGAQCIEYSYMDGNDISRRLATKYGFKYLKTQKRVRSWDNKEFDEVFYVLEIKE